MAKAKQKKRQRIPSNEINSGKRSRVNEVSQQTVTDTIDFVASQEDQEEKILLLSLQWTSLSMQIFAMMSSSNCRPKCGISLPRWPLCCHTWISVITLTNQIYRTRLVILMVVHLHLLRFQRCYSLNTNHFLKL